MVGRRRGERGPLLSRGKGSFESGSGSDFGSDLGLGVLKLSPHAPHL